MDFEGFIAPFFDNSPFIHSSIVKIQTNMVKIHMHNTTIHPQPPPSSKSFFLFVQHNASLGMPPGRMIHIDHNKICSVDHTLMSLLNRTFEKAIKRKR